MMGRHVSRSRRAGVLGENPTGEDGEVSTREIHRGGRVGDEGSESTRVQRTNVFPVDGGSGSHEGRFDCSTKEDDEDAVTELVENVAKRSNQLLRSREAATEESIRILRDLERKVRAALAGQTLRGMCNLVPRCTQPLLGARALDPESEHGVDTFLPLDGSEVLVIDRSGRFRVAAVCDNGHDWYDRAVEDEDVGESTLQLASDAMQFVLERHLTRVDRGIRDYAVIVELAERLGKALGV